MARGVHGPDGHRGLAGRFETALDRGDPLPEVAEQILAHAALLAVTDLGRLVVHLATAWQGQGVVEQALGELVAGDSVTEETWRALSDRTPPLTEGQRDRLMAALEVASQRFQRRDTRMKQPLPSSRRRAA